MRPRFLCHKLLWPPPVEILFEKFIRSPRHVLQKPYYTIITAEYVWIKNFQLLLAQRGLILLLDFYATELYWYVFTLEVFPSHNYYPLRVHDSYVNKIYIKYGIFFVSWQLKSGCTLTRLRTFKICYYKTNVNVCGSSIRTEKIGRISAQEPICGSETLKSWFTSITCDLLKQFGVMVHECLA